MLLGDIDADVWLDKDVSIGVVDFYNILLCLSRWRVLEWPNGLLLCTCTMGGIVMLVLISWLFCRVKGFLETMLEL